MAASSHKFTVPETTRRWKVPTAFPTRAGSKLLSGAGQNSNAVLILAAPGQR